jgi:hypothetical protein
MLVFSWRPNTGADRRLVCHDALESVLKKLRKKYHRLFSPLLFSGPKKITGKIMWNVLYQSYKK